MPDGALVYPTGTASRIRREYLDVDIPADSAQCLTTIWSSDWSGPAGNLRR